MIFKPELHLRPKSYKLEGGPSFGGGIENNDAVKQAPEKKEVNSFSVDNFLRNKIDSINRVRESAATDKSKNILNKLENKVSELNTALEHKLLTINFEPAENIFAQASEMLSIVENPDNKTTVPVEQIRSNENAEHLAEIQRVVETIKNASVEDIWTAIKSMPEDVLASLALDLTPVFGDIKALTESITGEDLLTDDNKTNIERFVDAASAAPVLGFGADLVKGAGELLPYLAVVQAIKKTEKVKESREALDSFDFADYLGNKLAKKSEITKKYGDFTNPQAKQEWKEFMKPYKEEIIKKNIDTKEFTKRESFAYKFFNKEIKEEVKDAENNPEILFKILDIPYEKSSLNILQGMRKNFHPDKYNYLGDEAFVENMDTATKALNNMITHLRKLPN